MEKGEEYAVEKVVGMQNSALKGKMKQDFQDFLSEAEKLLLSAKEKKISLAIMVSKQTPKEGDAEKMECNQAIMLQGKKGEIMECVLDFIKEEV